MIDTPSLPEDPTGGLRRGPRMRSVAVQEPTIEPQPALRVGLLGGSFNPAHEGHRTISIEALRRLRLDRIWWLVSPQNPLKPRAGMAPLAQRLATAREVARHPRIQVLDLEQKFGTGYTVDLIRRLRQWTGYHFVMLLGADNLGQLPRWRHWGELVRSVGIAVAERQPYSYPSLVGAAASRLAMARLPPERAPEVAMRAAPAWTFLRMRPHPASSTEIRRQRARTGERPQEDT